MVPSRQGEPWFRRPLAGDDPVHLTLAPAPHQPRATGARRPKMLIVTRLFGAPITPEQPGEGAPHEGRAIPPSAARRGR